MWLHKFIPQPCFDNAGASSGGGGGGSNRGGIKAGGADRRDSEPGGIGLSANSGRADSGNADRGGGGGSAVTRAALPPTTYAPPRVTTPTIAAPTLAQLTALTPKSYTAPVTAANAATYGPAGMMSVPSVASTPDLANSIANAATVSRAKTASPNTSMGPMSQPGTSSNSGYGSLADRAAAAAPSVGTPGGISGGAMASRGLDRGGSGTPGGISGGAMASRGLDGPSFSGGPQSNLAAKSDRGVPSLNTPSDTINGVNVAGKSDFGVPTSGPNRGALSDFAGVTGVNRTAKADQPVGLLSSPLSNLSDAEISSLIGSIVRDPRAGTSGLNPQGAFATNNPSDLSLTKSALSQGLPTRETMAGLLNTPDPTKAIQDRLSISTAGPAPSLNSRAVNEMVKQAVPSMRDQNFYSSDNAYQGVNFPNVNEAYPTSTNLSDQPGAFSNTTDTSGYTEATDIAQDVVTGNYSDAISKTIDRFGVGTAMQIAGLLSGLGGNAPSNAQDREAGIGRGEQDAIKQTVMGILNSGGGDNGDNGTDTGTDTTPPPTQNPWTPPGLLSRPYSNPFAYRNPWLNV